ncbi:serine threonine- kinase pim-3 [Brachionus plicatilis]|uniref:Serine/threonine-protein kinase 1 n=1 Tax=Brachionus plicatilis TaxID=10195 RepID=A0A3M7RAP3_BRAPC|nr:serine threonine- kinase pim-3 [Brachionus plicatilis]
MSFELNEAMVDPGEVSVCRFGGGLKRQSSAIKSNLSQLACMPKSANAKLFHLTSNPKSSTYSSSSSSNTSSSSSTGSNESSVALAVKKALPKQPGAECASPATATAATSSTSAGAAKSFNIENELIKYTKGLHITSNYLSSYTLGEHVRNGGFSEIYEGERIKSREPVIIKLIPKDRTKNWLMVHNKKYPAEILLHKMSNSVDGVVKMVEFFEQEREWVIIMPKVNNCVDLFDYLESKNKGRLCEREACYFFKQLIRINMELLSRGVVHRDIKSENLLVEMDTMKLILIDFGASAISRQNHAQLQYYTDFHGTRQYKPPEYIAHKKYTAHASTIWTLGILLYDMCNGQLPFETEQDILEYNIQMKASLSHEYKELLFDCLKREPAMRPALADLLLYQWISVYGDYVPHTAQDNKLHTK